MSNIILILAIFGWAILTYFAFKINKTLGNIFVGIMAIALPAYFATYTPADYTLNVVGLKLQLGFTSYANLFAWLVVILGALALIYSIPFMNKKDRLGWFYMNFIFSIGAMLGILMSQDLVSLFIFWEIMTWSSYLIVIYNGKDVNKVGIKYMVYSAIGAYAMLMAIVLINKWSGSTNIQNYFDTFAQYSNGAKILTSLLLLTGFAVKAALMPLHVWAPDAYEKAPTSYTALFSGALSKMGIYGMGLVAVNLFLHNNMHLAGEILAWLGAITAVLATFWAIFQNDVKKLLAWSSVGQLGYIAVGLGIGTELSVFAGIYLALLHAMFKGVLFMALGAVEYRTGQTDFRKMGGLIKKMPWTFFSALVAIIALAGMPPLPGFITKWLIYESVIIDGHWLLVIFIFLASTSAFLYSFRFLYGIFLGHPTEETKDVKEANILMILPMILISVFVIILGSFPGVVFGPISNAMKTLGFEHVTWHMSVLTNAWGDSVWLKYANATFVAVFLVFLVIITWVNHKRTRVVSVKDIATSGEPIREGDNFHFSEFFYQPFWRAISPVMKYRIETFYNRIAAGIEEFFQYFRRIYSGNGQTYAYYVIIFLAILLAVSSTIF
jgi:NADH-quinone oxidoreductase subunit M